MVRRVLRQQAFHLAAGRLAGSYRRSTCGHSFRSLPTEHTGLRFLVAASVAGLVAVGPAGIADNPSSVADRRVDSAVAAAGTVSMDLGNCCCFLGDLGRRRRRRSGRGRGRRSFPAAARLVEIEGRDNWRCVLRRGLSP